MSEYCKDCIHDEVCGLTHCGQTIACSYFKPKWISVKDGLPEADKDVLLCFGQGNFRMAVGGKYKCDEGWYSITDAEYYTDCDTPPTHWMPLPEPPKEAH